MNPNLIPRQFLVKSTGVAATILLIYLVASTVTLTNAQQNELAQDDLGSYLLTEAELENMYPWGQAAPSEASPYQYRATPEGPGGAGELGRFYVGFWVHRYIDEIAQSGHVLPKAVKADELSITFELIRYEEGVRSAVDFYKEWGAEKWRESEKSFTSFDVDFEDVSVGDVAYAANLYRKVDMSQQKMFYFSPADTKMVRLCFVKGRFYVQISMTGSSEKFVGLFGTGNEGAFLLEGDRAAEPFPTDRSVPTVQKVLSLARIVEAKLPGGVATAGDADGDGIPNDRDLCMLTKGVAWLGGCPDRGPAAGDLVFRYGVPSEWGPWHPTSSFSEGGYNFGHVGVFAGDFEADQSYKVRHKNGVDVWRGTPDQPAIRKVHLREGEYIRPGDVVPNAVIEASIDYGGVTVSSLDNFKADNTRLGGNEAFLQVGAPLGGLTIDQRKKIMEKMAQFAADTDAGNLQFESFNNNCARTTMIAYSEAGYNPWGKVPKGGYFAVFGLLGKTITPNLLASWMGPVWGMDRPRSGVVQPTGQDLRKVSILAESPVEIHIYDSAGQHTGPVEDGCQAQIPYTEYWQLENDYKVLNILAKAEDTYRLRVESYGEGSFNLTVISFNYFESQQGHMARYEQVAIGSWTIAEVMLRANQSPSEEGLALKVDQYGDGSTTRMEKPKIESFTVEGGTSTGTETITITESSIETGTKTVHETGGGYLYGLVVLVLVLVVAVVFYVRRSQFSLRSRAVHVAATPTAAQAYVYCENCGRSIAAGSVYCPHCGDKQGE